MTVLGHVLVRGPPPRGTKLYYTSDRVRFKSGRKVHTAGVESFGIALSLKVKFFAVEAVLQHAKPTYKHKENTWYQSY